MLIDKKDYEKVAQTQKFMGVRRNKKKQPQDSESYDIYELVAKDISWFVYFL